MSQGMKTICSCGDNNPHIVAKRVTLDGYSVDLWNDGAITDRMGNGLRPSKKRSLSLWETASRVCITTWAELIQKPLKPQGTN